MLLEIFYKNVKKILIPNLVYWLYFAVAALVD